jgi:pyruvate/2-oxoglutarate dehydrogenase complex dihydrolipoamide acyltransferase (E2) component
MIFLLLKFLLKKVKLPHLPLPKKRKVKKNRIYAFFFCMSETHKILKLLEEKPAAAAAATPAVSPISHHDVDTSKLSKPLSPAVLSLVLKYGIKDVDSIKASGNGGRILKGDVLAHLGLIKPKPAPKATLSIAPPRDQIVFAKVYCNLCARACVYVM